MMGPRQNNSVSAAMVTVDTQVKTMTLTGRKSHHRQRNVCIEGENPFLPGERAFFKLSLSKYRNYFIKNSMVRTLTFPAGYFEKGGGEKMEKKKTKRNESIMFLEHGPKKIKQ